MITGACAAPTLRHLDSSGVRGMESFFMVRRLMGLALRGTCGMFSSLCQNANVVMLSVQLLFGEGCWMENR